MKSFKPFSKGTGVLGVAATIFGVLNAATIPTPGCVPTPEIACGTVQLISLLGPIWGIIVAAAGSVLTLLSHSATGTGGKPEA